MPAWAFPLVIQAAEALFVATGTAFVSHQAGATPAQALLAGLAAGVAKLLPSQVVAAKQ